MGLHPSNWDSHCQPPDPLPQISHATFHLRPANPRDGWLWDVDSTLHFSAFGG